MPPPDRRVAILLALATFGLRLWTSDPRAAEEG
jgi:hypothetical protein